MKTARGDPRAGRLLPGNCKQNAKDVACLLGPWTIAKTSREESGRVKRTRSQAPAASARSEAQPGVWGNSLINQEAGGLGAAWQAPGLSALASAGAVASIEQRGVRSQAGELC